MNKLFIQIMDVRVILAAGSSIGQGEYNFSFKKEYDFSITKDNLEEFKKMVAEEFSKENLFQKGKKREKIHIIYSKQGILYRIIKIPIMPLDDLEKMMEFEKEEYLSVNPGDYEIRYKVVEKYDENNQLFWDVAVGGVEKKELNMLVEALDEVGFKINYVDILPANYERLFAQVQEKDLIILEDDGNSSRICILKNGKVNLYADFPIDNHQMFLSGDYSNLIVELRGYMEYYSSRNFGKNVEALILLRNYNKEIIREEIMAMAPIKIYDQKDLYDLLIKNKGELSQEISVERFYAPLSLMNL